jgi:hypothetical protein
MFNRFNLTVLIAIVLCSFFGCGGGSTSTIKEKKLAPCFNETNKDIRITWGQRDGIEHYSNGFHLLTDGTVLFFAYDSLTTKRVEREITFLSSETVCHIHERLKFAILKTQALYSPGPVSRYITYTNPSTKTIITGLWNAEFANFGSQYFREVYDTLNTIVSRELPDSTTKNNK